MSTAQIVDVPATQSVLDLWERVEGDKVLSRALARLLAANPQYIGQFHSLDHFETALRSAVEQNKAVDHASTLDRLSSLMALARMSGNAGRTDQAESFYNAALDTIVKARRDDHGMAHLVEEFDLMLADTHGPAAENGLRRRLRVQMLLHRSDPDEYANLREHAFEAFGRGDYAEAERIYLHLIARSFDIAGTYVHMARIYIVTHRMDEARAAVARAWEHRATACPIYVLLRVHFLRALMATIDGQDASADLTAIREQLRGPDTRHVWSIRPALVALQSRLAPEAFALFDQLATQLSDSPI